MPPQATNIWISAGETSGDQRGAEFLAALGAERPVSARGLAGPALRAAGAAALVPTESLGAIGLFEAAGAIPQTAAVFARALWDCRRRRPQLAVLVDYGEFHMRLGARLRRMGVPVFHLAPPKLWAWGRWRVRRLRRSADALGVLFPFEQEFYERRGFRAAVVGHPAAALRHAKRPAVRDRLLLLPGSRPGELARHLPLLLAAARQAQPSLPGLRPTLVVAPGLDVPAATSLPAQLDVRRAHGPEALADGALALAASGTVNLELAAWGVPQVVCYRVSAATAAIGRALVQPDWLNPVNINAGAGVVPEFLQDDATPEALAAALNRVWREREAQLTAVAPVIAALDRPEGLRAAARLAWELVP